MPEDRTARFRDHHDPLRAGQTVPRTEVAQNVHAGVPRSGHLSGKCGELLPAGYRESLPAGERDGDRRICVARRTEFADGRRVHEGATERQTPWNLTPRK